MEFLVIFIFSNEYPTEESIFYYKYGTLLHMATLSILFVGSLLVAGAYALKLQCGCCTHNESTEEEILLVNKVENGKNDRVTVNAQ